MYCIGRAQVGGAGQDIETKICPSAKVAGFAVRTVRDGGGWRASVLVNCQTSDLSQRHTGGGEHDSLEPKDGRSHMASIVVKVFQQEMMTSQKNRSKRCSR